MANEKTMQNNVAKYLGKGSCEVAREIRLSTMRFDLVQYDKKRGVFKVVECKPTNSQTGIAKAFGQASGYQIKIRGLADQFVDAVSKQMHLRFGRWMEATDRARRIRVEMYVSLPEKSCRDIQFLRELRQQYPGVGIIRCKKDGSCRPHLLIHSKQDRQIAQSATETLLLECKWTPPSINVNN